MKLIVQLEIITDIPITNGSLTRIKNTIWSNPDKVTETIIPNDLLSATLSDKPILSNVEIMVKP